jgi:hypothetical protein
MRTNEMVRPRGEPDDPDSRHTTDVRPRLWCRVVVARGRADGARPRLSSGRTRTARYGPSDNEWPSRHSALGRSLTGLNL